MQRLIPYAGYDPTEDEFIEADHSVQSRNFALARSRRQCLDPERVVYMRQQGMSHRVIGETIAAEDGRPLPYRSDWIARILTKERHK